MQEPDRPLELADLRKWCGEFKPNDSADEFIKIRPGRQRKVYGRHAPRGWWVYRPAVISVFGSLRRTPEIAALVNQQSLDEIRDQMDSGVRQLIYRSHAGDKKALELFIRLLKKSILALEQFGTFQPDMVQAEAERSPDWPVLMSLNPQQISWLKSKLHYLKVGTKATTPTRPGQRIDPRNFWTVLASSAYHVCSLNTKIVPQLLALKGGGKGKRVQDRFWNTPVSATIYYPSGGEAIIVTDWQAKCVKLSEPITSGNLDLWWDTVKGCVLEHWHSHPDEYQKALAKIGQPEVEEWRRRNMAFSEVRQAFKSLVGQQRYK